MKVVHAAGPGLALLALLSACDRHDPPSDRLERAAEELVAQVEQEALPVRQAQGPWAPRNECNAVPGGTDFLASLQAAIDTRDADALMALVADDVKLDFGGGTGKAELRQRLAADDGALWDELAQLFALGCAAKDQTTMTLPWYFAQEIPVDPYMGAIVIGEDVPLRAAPRSDAEVVARLSWQAVEQLPSETAGPGNAFVRWKDPASGQEVEGYVASDALRAILDYRLIASRRNDRWRITALVAGD